jgi:hypothetical protein
MVTEEEVSASDGNYFIASKWLNADKVSFSGLEIRMISVVEFHYCSTSFSNCSA